VGINSKRRWGKDPPERRTHKTVPRGRLTEQKDSGRSNCESNVCKGSGRKKKRPHAEGKGEDWEKWSTEGEETKGKQKGETGGKEKKHEPMSRGAHSASNKVKGL